MADYTANAKGIGNTKRAKKTEQGEGKAKGQTLHRYEIVADAEIMGGEIFLNTATTLAASDTCTITIVAG